MVALGAVVVVFAAMDAGRRGSPHCGGRWSRWVWWRPEWGEEEGRGIGIGSFRHDGVLLAGIGGRFEHVDIEGRSCSSPTALDGLSDAAGLGEYAVLPLIREFRIRVRGGGLAFVHGCKCVRVRGGCSAWAGEKVWGRVVPRGRRWGVALAAASGV